MTARVRPVWWAALAATAAWTLVALWSGEPGGPDASGDTVEAVAIVRSASAVPPSARASAAALAAASARVLNRDPLEPDAGRGVMDGVAPPAPPPQPKAPPAPPPPPPAPVSSAPVAAVGPPLQLLGVVKAGTPTPHVFFSLADRLIQARAGDLIDGRFRVDEIRPDRIILTVLPEQRRMEIPITTAPSGG